MTIILRIEEEKDASDIKQRVAFVTIRADESQILNDIHAVAGLSEYPLLNKGVDDLVSQIMKLKQEEVKEKNKKFIVKKIKNKK